MLRFSCPYCGTHYELDDKFSGRKVCCENCNVKFYVSANGTVTEIESVLDKTIPPHRIPTAHGSGENDLTLPGKRERMNDGGFAIGDLIMNRYKVIAELGRGGMGVVYKCFDETAGIEVALKALPPELSHNNLEMEDIKDNFQLVSKLVHQNIAISKNLEKDNSNGNYYLIMECCDGENLRYWIRRKWQEGGLTTEDVLPIIQQVADALDYAHEQKIIHRDIKPGNIMINQAGRVKVLDFGLAAQIHTSLTRVSAAYHGTSGTGPYMAPEQWRGRAQGAAADQYSLAVMAYEMLAGHLPFENSDPAVLKQAVLNERPEAVVGVSKSVQDAIRRAMSKKPSERFVRCADFTAALAGKKVDTFSRITKSVLKWLVVLSVIVLFVISGQYYLQDRQYRNVAEYLSEAQAAKADFKWKDVLRFAQAVLQLEPENITARKLLDEAEAKIEEIRHLVDLKNITERKKSNIERENYDRGQCFGKYLDALAKDFNDGVGSMEINELQKARDSFIAAGKSADWIIANAPLRRRVPPKKELVIQAKDQADKANASTLSPVLYRSASAVLDKADKEYESGNFAAALNGLDRALKSYQDAGRQSVERTFKTVAVKTLPGSRIELCQDSIEKFSGNADQDGRVIFSKVKCGIYELKISAEHHVSHSSVIKVENDVVQTVNLEKLRFSLTVSGNDGMSGKIFFGALKVYDFEIPATGYVVINGLEPGKYAIECSQTGFIPQRHDIDVKENSVLPVRLVPITEKVVIRKAPSPVDLKLYFSVSEKLLNFIHEKGIEIKIGNGAWKAVKTFPYLQKAAPGEVVISVRGEGIEALTHVCRISRKGGEVLLDVKPKSSRVVLSSNHSKAEFTIGDKSFRGGAEVVIEPFREYVVTARSRRQSIEKKIISSVPGEKLEISFSFTSDVHPMQKEYLRGVKLFNAGKYKDALPVLENAAKACHPKAALLVAKIYEDGLGMVFSNREKARYWYLEAAKEKEPVAAVKIADDIYDGYYKATAVKMLELYQIAIDAGNPEVSYKVSQIYKNGFTGEVPPDDGKSLEYLQKAAELEFPEAMYELGVRYAEGDGVPRNSKTALEWIKKAADRKFKPAIEYWERINQ